MVSKTWSPLAMSNGPRLHDYIRELNAASFGGKGSSRWGDLGADLAHMQHYSNPDGSEFSMVFNFEHLGLGSDKWSSRFDPLAFKRAMARHQQGLHGRGWNSLFLGNHDLPRAVSRFGDDSPKWRETSAKLWAMVLQLMQAPLHLSGRRAGHDQPPLAAGRAARRGGDQLPRQPGGAGACRAESAARCHRPRQRPHPDAVGRWPHAGFSTATPWIALNANHIEINAAEQLARPDSPFHCYRRLIALRKAHLSFATATSSCWMGTTRSHRLSPPLAGSGQRRAAHPAAARQPHRAPLVMPHFDQVEAGATLLMSNYRGSPPPPLPLSGGRLDAASTGVTEAPSSAMEGGPAPDDFLLGCRCAPAIYSLKTSRFQARTALPGNIQSPPTIDNGNSSTPCFIGNNRHQNDVFIIKRRY